MSYLTFIVGMVEALAWPIAAVVIVFLLRNNISSLLDNISKLKAGGIEAEFHRLQQEVDEVASKADAVVNSLEEPEDEGEEGALPDLTEEEWLVLSAMADGRYVWRSVAGVANQLKISKKAVNTLYTQLIGKGLVTQTTNQQGSLRWHPTILGRKVLASRVSV